MKKELYELTNPQKSIWNMEQYYTGTTINNLCGSLKIDKEVDFEKFEQAIRKFIELNKSFSIKIEKEENAPKQYFSNLTNFEIKKININSEEDIEKIEHEMVNEKFEIFDSLLFEFRIFKLPNNHGGFVVKCHHLISDAATFALIGNNIAKIYYNLINNIDEEYPTYSYIDAIKSEQEYLLSEKFKKDEEYWNNQFSEIPDIATIPASFKNVSKYRSNSTRKSFILSKDKISEIKELCQKEKISIFNFFMAIYSLYISRITNLENIVIGTPILNRTNFSEKNTAGMFISNVPLKINVDDNITFLDFTSKIARDSLSMLRHQKYPYQYLLENLRKQNTNVPNLYDTLLSYQITKANDKSVDLPYSVHWCETEHISCGINIHLHDNNDSGNLIVSYDYLIDKYSEDDITATHNRILTIMEQVLKNDNIYLKDIELVTNEEKNKILNEFNNTESSYPKNKTIIELFEEQAQKTPDKIAIIFGEQKLTYKELNEKANSLAYLLKNNYKITNNNLVGIMVNRSLEMIIAILAVLKADGTYIPIDPSFPKDRIQYMLDSGNAKLLLTLEDLKNSVEFSNKLLIDLNKDDIYNLPNKNLNHTATPEDLIYVIFTSGSTGLPKGVMLKNKNIVNFVFGMMKEFNFTTNDIIASITTISFDIFVLESLMPLTNGLTVVIANEQEQTNVDLFNKLCLKNKVNIVQTTPSRIQAFIASTQFTEFLKNLTHLLIGGEPFPSSLLEKLKQISNTKIYNMYGPTETAVWSTLQNLTDEKDITIGTPIINTKCYILDKNYKLLPYGISGDLFIAGDGVSKGYLNRDDITSQSFVENPFVPGTKMYKTGDIAYLNKNNKLICLGRSDNQVKIRGLRIELGEIEDKINKLPNITSCAVVKKLDQNSRDILCAYLTADCKIDTQKIQADLKDFLPKYMIPSHFVQIDELPHTPNGKIDRKKLPDPVFKKSNQNIVKPRNDVDKKLLNIFSDIFKQKIENIEDSFFELGGDSLLSISLCAEVQSEFNTKIFVKDILENPIIKDLSDLIAQSENNLRLPVLTHTPKAEYYPISAEQKMIYFSSNVSGNNSILYNIPGAVIIDGILDSNKLEKCFNLLIDRHEALRTYFTIYKNEVVQKIKEKIDFKLDVTENVDFNNFDNILKDFIQPFNLENAPLFRIKYLKFKNKKSAILLDMHHIISDGISISLFINELCKLYNNLNAELPKLEFTYKDFSNLINDDIFKENYKEAEKYWLKQFEEEIPVLNMPISGVRPAVQTFEGMRIYQKIDNKLLNNFAKKYNFTPYMILICAYYILLSKYSGQEDIVIGCPNIGRDLEQSQNIIGMFVNTLPLRNRVSSNLTVLEFLNNLKENVTNGFKYQIYPFNDIVDKLNIKRETSRNPLFDVMFTYQSNGYEKIDINGINATYHIPDTGTSKFDLSLEAVPLEDNINLTFEFSTKLFNKKFIENLSEHYINILNNILENKNLKISDINMLSKEEEQKILYGFNNTKKPYPNKTFSKLFEEQVEKTPNNIALVFGDQQLTFKELNEKANSLAYYLRTKIKKEDLVGIMVNRSLEMIIAILATMKAGGAYIPIDPSYPKDRIDYILSNSNSAILLTSKKLENKIDFKNKAIIDLENNDIYSLPSDNLENINSLNDLLYILFTSGSTGNPKGVMQTQKTLVNFTHYCNDYVGYLKNPGNQAIVSISTVSFDIFSFEALIPLQRGVKVVIANENEQTTPNLLNDLIIKNNVTATQATPSVMQLFVNNIDAIPALKDLKYLTLTGEQVPINLVKKLKEFGDITIYDGYGPTETYYCTLTEVTGDFITIGKPFYNDQMYILDNNLKPVPVGVIGEIYISGDGVAKGYLHREELTAKSFIENPFIPGTTMYKSGDLGKYLENGDILCLGRADHQIKIRGLRIELGEIETLLSKYPNIEEVAVVKQEMNNREFISAYFVANKRISINELRKYLAKSLPRYMIPSYYTALDSFPYTPNGKIDRKILPLPKEISNIEKENYVAPTTELQKTLVSIFEKILNTSPVGINDNFFELGGDSLLAMNLNIELLEITNKITFSDIFKYSTVAELEEKINSDDEKALLSKFENLPEYYLKILKQTTENSEIKEYHPKNILLTGSTGYLGIHILEEFLKNENCKIYCIVRKEPGMSIYSKLAQKLHYYFGEKYDTLLEERIIAINGDICKPDFGLEPKELLELANNIDLVIHCAAIVAHFGNYNNFYSSNVKSVKYISNFCKGFDKKLYHISTAGVSGKNLDTSYLSNSKINKKISSPKFCENSLYIGQSLTSVYTYSKFEAEKIVLDAINQNVDAYILRIGNLMPRLSDGLFQENILQNAFLTNIAGFMKLGIIPDYLLKMPLEFTPVDTAAQAIYTLVTHPSKKNRIFHVYNHKMISLKKFLKIVKKFGYNVKILPEDEFKKKTQDIIQNEEEQNNFSNIANYFDNNYHLNYIGSINLKSNFTIKYLKKCRFKWPTIRKQYLIDFINLLRKVI